MGEFINSQIVAARKKEVAISDCGLRQCRRPARYRITVWRFVVFHNPVSLHLTLLTSFADAVIRQVAGAGA